MKLDEFNRRFRRGDLSPEDVIETVMSDPELQTEWRKRCAKYHAKKRRERSRSPAV